jgi:hypothetical protein
MLRPTGEDVSQLVDELRLLHLSRDAGALPDCEIRRERFLGLTKSFIAVRPVS